MCEGQSDKSVVKDEFIKVQILQSHFSDFFMKFIGRNRTSLFEHFILANGFQYESTEMTSNKFTSTAICAVTVASCAAAVIQTLADLSKKR